LPGRYTVISGERRFRAANLAGLASIPAVVNQGDEALDRTLAIQLVENLQRDDLTPLERAHAIGALRDAHNLSIRDIAEKLSISKSAVQRSLEILQLPDDLLNALREGAAESKVLLLAKIDDPTLRATYLKDLDVLTRSELERNIQSKRSTEANDDAVQRVVSAEDMRIADEIQRALGMKVKLVRSGAGSENGRLTIDFYGDADLQVIFRKLISEA
jgi:ParB family chromosome partitioning protein